MPDDPQRYLDPVALAKLRNLELQARLIVEGYLSGMHKSPYHGFSVEFAQHREYVAGDDLKHLDWKVFSRTGRFYLKQYEEETNLACWMLVDASESMKYGSGPTRPDGRPHVSKYDYAAMSAAALAYMVLQQQDSAGLVTFDDQVRAVLKPSSQPSLSETDRQYPQCGTGPRAHAAWGRSSTTWPSASCAAASSWCSATCSTSRNEVLTGSNAPAAPAARSRSSSTCWTGRRRSSRSRNRRCSAAWSSCRTC